MGMSTIYSVGVVERYTLSNVLIQSVGSLLTAKSFGSIQTNAHLESKNGGVNKECQQQKRQLARLTRYPI